MLALALSLPALYVKGDFMARTKKNQPNENTKHNDDALQQLDSIDKSLIEADLIENKKVEIVCKRFNAYTKICLSDLGKGQIKQHIKKYSLEEVLDALDSSLNYYVKDISDKDQIVKAVNNIPKTCAWNRKVKEHPEVQGFSHICNVARYYWWKHNRSSLFRIVSSAYYNFGVDIETMLDFARKSSGMMQFIERLDEKTGSNQ